MKLRQSLRGGERLRLGDPPDPPVGPPPQSPGPEPPPPPAQPHHRTENQLAEIFLRFDSIFFVFTHVTQSVSHS